MQEGHADELWSHTSSIMALIANCNRDPEKRKHPFTPADFNPLAHRQTESEAKERPLSELKDEWLAMARQRGV